jgi:hypothetical protein
MTPKIKNKKPASAKEHDAYVKAALKRIDALSQKGREMDRKIAPKLRELRKIVNE